ncbi:hypothetical protein MRS44_014860 [Fusarium solani]|uniref:Lipid droplet-associated hydrolase n=1 Tax=Fusarium solani TaxID=169388 RepID=A0A9P9K2T7_FUSSL|nr:uncharacterized protein B0J15DRAFT_79798 [Fusarium solani]KAH7247047.1 hypothetical protein B0J15DRAFT_79798 [Fusarium solani]KAJ3457719.1 hypothetical protein MRS44_014860 [Fusarium solani]KAJ4219429.1 hypothetical protein NW759_007819 [Fusarium solani]
MVSNIWLPSNRHNEATHHALIYYVCGNPGLIEYYTDFLKLLRGLLDKVEHDTAYDIYGRNLLGFVDDEHEPFGPENQPWDLNGQIEGIYDDVAARRVDSKPYDFAILMGHSVGSYICVEIFHRHLESPERAPHLNLRHGFLLFPTLTHIARSPSGLKFTALRRAVPFLDTTTHIVARLLLSFLTVAGLTWLVQRVMGFTPPTASVTARWLKSRDGVRQAVHLGMSELETICEERWSEELWAASQGPKGDAPRFFVFYAKSDHWVDDGEREGFIERRRGGVTKIEVDEGDIPHAFCTRDDASLEVAKRVCGWVEEIDRVGENH